MAGAQWTHARHAPCDADGGGGGMREQSEPRRFLIDLVAILALALALYFGRPQQPARVELPVATHQR